jgi:hypothetical protein
VADRRQRPGTFFIRRDGLANGGQRSQLETIARNEFTKAERRDPVDCSLFYLALRKKTILAGLWRTATGHPEQSSTQRFLTNDFSEQRWKTAALKNAYALMGKHRFGAYPPFKFRSPR